MKRFQHAIVTGGSSGIGKETARLLVRRGASVTLLARRADVLDAARAELVPDCASPSQRVLTVPVDVADRDAVTSAIARAESAIGPCDLTITSAGVVNPGYFAEVPIDLFEETMRVNYLGTLYALRAVLPGMRARGRGHVVLVSSGAGIVGIFGYAAYSPSKFALRGLAEVLRAEFAQEAVRVSIVYPPDTDTPQLAAENSDQAGRNARDRGRREDLAGGRRGALHPGRRRSEPVRDHAGVGDDLAASRAQRRSSAPRLAFRSDRGAGQEALARRRQLLFVFHGGFIRQRVGAERRRPAGVEIRVAQRQSSGADRVERPAIACQRPLEALEEQAFGLRHRTLLLTGGKKGLRSQRAQRRFVAWPLTWCPPSFASSSPKIHLRSSS